MKCTNCNNYFHNSDPDKTQCVYCLDSQEKLEYNSFEDEQDIEMLINPSGKVQPKFYD